MINVLNGNETFLQAGIKPEVCASNNKVCVGNDSCSFVSSPDKPVLRSCLSGHNCSSGNVTIRSGIIINYMITNLTYWTNYSIAASGCTAKGCGPLSEPLKVETDEHSPTCAPTVTTVGNTSSTSIAVAWRTIPRNCVHGVLSFYNVFTVPLWQMSEITCFNTTKCWKEFKKLLY